jgi:hypothetical protein
MRLALQLRLRAQTGGLTGATKHITNCPNYFMNFERFEKPKVIIQAGHTPLHAIGTVQLNGDTV